MSYFDAEKIPDECFGGPPTSSTGKAAPQYDRTSNALMLFYNKSKKNITAVDVSASRAAASAAPSLDGKQLVDGYQAFHREVFNLNLEHATSQFLLDPCLHQLMLTVLKLGNYQPYLQLCGAPAQTAAVIFDLTVQFFLGLLLHYRSRANIRSWLQEFKIMLSSFPEIANHFLDILVAGKENIWFTDYLLSCNDELARSSFASLLQSVIVVCIPLELQVEYAGESLISLPDSVMLAQEAVRKIIILASSEAPKHARTSNEIFVLIRDLAAIPYLRRFMLDLKTIESLIGIVIPSRLSEDSKHPVQRSKQAVSPSTRQDVYVLAPCAIEAIAALIGVPQVPKAPLLEDGSRVTLTAEAERAFTCIFSEISRDSSSIDLRTFLDFGERTSGQVKKKSIMIVKCIHLCNNKMSICNRSMACNLILTKLTRKELDFGQYASSFTT